ncbi:MAG: hypothetical protein ACLFQV_12060 [Vulcanimicrobiota bacterium]
MSRKKRPSSMEFEIPEIGIKALEYVEKAQAEEKERKEKEAEEEARTQKEDVGTVDDMAKILERQAMKIHEQAPMRPQAPVKNQENKPAQPPGQMIIGLSGAYVGGGIPSDKARKGKKKKGPHAEMLEFLEESIDEYEKYLKNIGRNGLAAVNLGYYRDDIQDVLDNLKYDPDVDLKEYWQRIVKLDLELKAKASLYVREVGHANFKQYQIINDPPAIRWWWYLNRSVASPITEKTKFWELWK